MKKLIFALFALAVLACAEEKPKDYVTFSGKITNKNSDEIKIYNRTYSKVIKVYEDGTFSDTLNVIKGKYNFYKNTRSIKY